MTNRSTSGFSDNRKKIIAYAAPVLVVLLLVWFLPREDKFAYEYEEGRPWRYAQLIAPYDFTVYKTEKEIQAEKDSVKKNFAPYYRLDTVMMNEQINTMMDNVPNVPNNDIRDLPMLKDLLTQVYKAGVIDPKVYDALAATKSKSIVVVDATGAQLRSLNEIETPESAYKKYIDSNSLGVSAGYLKRYNLNKYIVGNLVEDVERTEYELGRAMAVSDSCGRMQTGQLIVNRGQIITGEHMKVLNSMKKESERRLDLLQGYWVILLGQMVFISIVVLLYYFYLRLFRRDYLNSPHHLLLAYSLLVLFPLLTYLMVDIKFSNIYLLPFAMIAIFVRIFLDSRTAFVTMVTSAVLASLVLVTAYEFVLLQIIVAMVVVYSLRELSLRSQLFKTAALATATSLLIYNANALAHGMEFQALDLQRNVYICLSGILLLFAYPLMYVIEKVFRFTSDVTLIELTNINHPLLRMMSKVAQGTFNHSMQVANLAMEVADKIGAKSQLARTGALYHDIGKISNPAFFTENQSGVNPHDQLTEVESAQIITAHVTDGLRLAEKYHLPQEIRNFITTHHGAGMAKYFYIQHVNKYPHDAEDKEVFSYPGPNPFTREQAVLMMCDAVEAASRSLKEYTEESIANLVNKIVDGQLADGHFKECPITFKDIADAKQVLIDSLKTIYHTRISYPELKANQPAPVIKNRPGLFGGGLPGTWRRQP
jgi:putative nucleotidyltransferase with HDIG domain